MAKVQVLGTGCSRYGYLLKNAQAAASERQSGDTVEKIDDIMQVLEFNPSALPALAIDGKVVSVGKLPSSELSPHQAAVQTSRMRGST
ncbi:MAG: thioredoxin family protein [Planctomycetales bacterium]|nr:thioredoxin family protein [Planctomycetales bacterium]